jgi:hypothetical protein
MSGSKNIGWQVCFLARPWILLDSIMLNIFSFLRRGKPYNLSDQAARSWRDRAAMASTLTAMIHPVPEVLRVVDIGAGDQKLKEVLERSFRISYSGYDILPQSGQVTPWNVENGLPPDLGDVLYALGLLEYLTSLQGVFDQIAERGRHFIFSYVTSDGGKYSDSHRERLGWKTNHSIHEIESMLATANLTIVKRVEMKSDFYTMWLIKSEPAGVR